MSSASRKLLQELEEQADQLQALAEERRHRKRRKRFDHDAYRRLYAEALQEMGRDALNELIMTTVSADQGSQTSPT